MQNHADTFKPPGDGQNDMPDGKALFGNVLGLIYLAIMALSAFWALLMRKGGTLGTRAYWFDYGCANLLFLALKQHYFYSPCHELFIGAMVLMTAMFLFQLFATLKRKEHVHTKCIGTPWLWGGEATEFVLGVGLGLGIAFAYPAAAPFGYFLISSATALAIRGWMIEERDRLRSVQMDDALWEQDYMMRNYERHSK